MKHQNWHIFEVPIVEFTEANDAIRDGDVWTKCLGKQMSY